MPEEATHAYTRQHKTTGLQAPYEGPFRIESRPSRSTVRLEVGVYSSGEKRYEIRHLNDIKFAHPGSLAAPASRPKLGRPTSAPASSSKSTDGSSDPQPPTEKELCLPAKNPQPVEPTKQTRFPARSTRNPAPAYIDAFSIASSGGPPTALPFPSTTQRGWSASRQEIAQLNQLISRSQK